MILSAAAMAVAPAAAASPPATPKLVIAISVDQFSADLFERYRASYTGGLKRLADGLAFANGYQSHAATETCPGHSTILTGEHPSHTGITANNWYDAAIGKSVYCVSVPGATDPQARGPQNMRVDTLGDWLKRAEPGARSIAVAGKDRAAITMAGRHADAVYWWVDGRGFSTSASAGPADAQVTAPAEAFNEVLFSRWRAQPPALWPTVPLAACAPLQQPHRFGTLTVSGKVPPEASLAVEAGADFPAAAAFNDQLRASPSFDPLVLRFASELIDRDRLGRGPATDLAAISLSATDYVGHRYGNGGAEMCVQTHAVDDALGTFLARIDRLGIPYVVVLTADHGSTDAAERASEHGLPAARIDGSALVRALNADLRQALGLPEDPIAGEDPQQLVIKAADPQTKTRIRARAVAWLKARPEVTAVFAAPEIVAAVPPRSIAPDKLTVVQRLNESYVPGRSGDIAVVYRRYASLGMPRKTGDVVAGHGSPWDYDRRVPILFWWRGVAGQREPAPVETVDIAPTLAAMIGIKAPPVDGHCLSEVTQRCHHAQTATRVYRAAVPDQGQPNRR